MPSIEEIENSWDFSFWVPDGAKQRLRASIEAAIRAARAEDRAKLEPYIRHGKKLGHVCAAMKHSADGCDCGLAELIALKD